MNGLECHRGGTNIYSLHVISSWVNPVWIDEHEVELLALIGSQRGLVAQSSWHGVKPSMSALMTFSDLDIVSLLSCSLFHRFDSIVTQRGFESWFGCWSAC